MGPFWLENELYIYLLPLHASDAVLIPAICKLLEELTYFSTSRQNCLLGRVAILRQNTHVHLRAADKKL